MAAASRPSSTWTGSIELIADGGGGARAEAPGSIEYRAVAERPVAGGVASSWQDSPPHADLRRPRTGQPPVGHRRQRVPRLPPRLRRDGGGPRPPEDRRGDPDSRPRSARTSRSPRSISTRSGRTSPIASTCRCGASELGHRGHARGDPPDAGQHRPRHDHQDRGHLPRPPRLDHVLASAPTATRSGRASTPSRSRRRWASRRPSPTSSASCRSTT